MALRAGDGPILIGIWDTASHFWCEECRRRDLPYYLFAYGVDMLVPLYGRLPEWRARDMAGAVRVVACSGATASLASNRFALATEPAVVLPSAGAPPPRAAVLRRASELRRDLGLADGPVVVSVGRLVARKGFDRVLAGVAELRATWPSLQYIVVGDGPERGPLEEYAREHAVTGAVHFLGAVDELTKWAAYEVCDVFAMPNRALGESDWEGFGIVFLEAAAAKRAAIGANTGGVPDAVVDGVTGLLVNPEDVNGFTDSLRRLLDDGALRIRLGEQAAAWAARERSAEASVDALCTSLGWN
jgi:phosphatidylinositol alpha-1,6-mannosyltransferase